MAEGTKSIADGGAPLQCDFPVAGTVCERTCTGGKGDDDDKSGTSYEDITECVQQKCLIQVGGCLSDTTCIPCLTQAPPDYCFANENFNAVVGCSLCSCMASADPEDADKYCRKEPSDDSSSSKPDDTDSGSVTPCTASQTLQGSSAVLDFSQCTDIDQVKMMVVDFDNNNFGALDSFETCAHSYNNDKDHGGRTAMSCMQILKNAIDAPTGDKNGEGVPTASIAALAKNLYEDAESFCDCSSKASKDCPQCPSFAKFKTLLAESLDACQSLDEIDCDAWNEFQAACQPMMASEFGHVSFSEPKQCEYMQNGCGGAGPFPAFRR